MAEGRNFGYEDPVLDDNIDRDNDEQEVNTTRPFQPGAASTPYHNGEQYEMQTMQHKQSGLPDTSYEETPMLRRSGSITDLQRERQNETKNEKKSVDMIKAKFPKAHFDNLKFEEALGKIQGKLLQYDPKRESTRF